MQEKLKFYGFHYCQILEVKFLQKSWKYNLENNLFHCAKDSFQACLFQLKYCQAKLALFAYVNSSNTEHRKKGKKGKRKKGPNSENGI